MSAKSNRSPYTALRGKTMPPAWVFDSSVWRNLRAEIAQADTDNDPVAVPVKLSDCDNNPQKLNYQIDRIRTASYAAANAAGVNGERFKVRTRVQRINGDGDSDLRNQFVPEVELVDGDAVVWITKHRQ